MKDKVGSTDRYDILTLIARYAHAIDDRRLDDCIELFADDAVVVVNGGSNEGRAAIRGWFDILARSPAGRHLTTNTDIWTDADGTLHALSDVAYIRRSENGGWTISVAGRYADTFVHTSAGLRFKRRDIAIN